MDSGMTSLHKIDGENEFAYFNANFNQLRQIFESDPNWVGNMMEVFGHYGLTRGMQSFRNSLFGCKIEKQGDNFFEVRGTVSFYYRIEAVSQTVSRIVPVAQLLTIHKIILPFQLAILCLFPVVFTPLLYKLQRLKTLNSSKLHLEALCKYLEIRGQQLFGPRQQGEI